MNHETYAIEQLREERVRSVACQACKAKPGKKCSFLDMDPNANGLRSHTARYVLAASRGLVPILPGGHRG